MSFEKKRGKNQNKNTSQKCRKLIFLALLQAPFGVINIFEGRFLFREILHQTCATFKTTSFWTVAEPTPNALVFTIAWYNVLQFVRCQCSHTNFTSSLKRCLLRSNSKVPLTRCPQGSEVIFCTPNKVPLRIVIIL